MKTRLSFVSNSSSASFIIHWRVKTMGDDVNVEKALDIIFSSPKEWSCGNDKAKWENLYDAVIDHTEENNNGTFTTTFWTSMMNTFDDFGQDAQSFVMALVASKNAQIIDSHVEED